VVRTSVNIKVRGKEGEAPSTGVHGRSPRLSYGGTQLILCFLWGFKRISA